MTAFRKFVLISRNELDRIKEKRIREYDQSLSALARTERDIEELLSDQTIANEDKLNTYNKLSQKFDKLRPGVVSIAPTGEFVPDPNAGIQPAPPTPPANQAEVRAKEAVVAPLAAAAVEAPDAAAQGEAAAVAKPDEGAVNVAKPDVVNVAEVNLPAQYTHKYSRLKILLNKNPDIIRTSPNGLLVINNHVLPDTSFKDLIRELYIHSGSHNTVGQNQFLQALKEIHVEPSIFSNSHVITKYSRLNSKRNSAPTQFAAGPPGKIPRTRFLYSK